MRNWKLILFFVVIIIFTFSSIVLSGMWKDKSTIKSVELKGNTTLSKDEIFDFAKLNDSIICSNALSLEMIEGRIAKHPNVKKVVVTKDAGIVKIEVSEKNPFAIASNGNDMFLVDDQLTIYNLKKEHRDLDIPVISGLSGELGVSTFGKNDLRDLKTAQYLICQSVKINKSLYNYISEISFVDSNGITLVTNDDATKVLFIDYGYLASSNKLELAGAVKDINSPVLREAVNTKLVQLNAFLKQIRVYKSSNTFKYIDMRFNDLIVVKYNNQQGDQ